MKILCTGGAGFIGSNLVFKLNQLGHTDITIVDRLGKSDKWRNLVGLKYSKYIEVEDFYPDSAGMYDIVFHLGACSSTRKLNASYLMQNNYDFSIKIMRAAVSNDVRFIYASSAATYGKGEMDDTLSPTLLRPLNAYGLSKNMIDQYAENVGWLDKIVGLKYFNIFGPNCEHKGVMESFVTKAYRQLKNDGQVILYDTYKDVPDGQDARDFLYVKDAVNMTLHFAFDEKGKTANGLFNIGSSIATSWKNIVYSTVDAIKGGNFLKLSCIKYSSLPCEIRDKYQYYTKADISKLRVSGYEKEITEISEGVKDYVQNYLIPDKKVAE